MPTGSAECTGLASSRCPMGAAIGQNGAMQAMQGAVLQRLADLNTRLRDSGDPARVRFASIEPDPEYDDETLVLVTWELPPPDPDPDSGWPLEQLDQYCALVTETLEDTDVVTECLFRSHAELTKEIQLGERIPEPV